MGPCLRLKIKGVSFRAHFLLNTARPYGKIPSYFHEIQNERLGTQIAPVRGQVGVKFEVESKMTWHKLNNKQEISKIIKRLVGSKNEIDVRMKGAKRIFKSRLLLLMQDNGSSGNGRHPRLIIEKLTPKEGNFLIQSVQKVVMESSINGHACRYDVKYMGTCNSDPFFGFFVSFPENFKVAERRREERYVHEMPELVSARFRLESGRPYDLYVNDHSGHGLGLLVTKKDFDLLKQINIGDKLRDMVIFAKSALIRGDGIVRHKTRIVKGRFEGCFILGIESDGIDGL